MKACFWGTRGSLPSSIKGFTIREKIASAIARSRSENLDAPEQIERFIDSLPFAARSTYGGNTSCVELIGLPEYFIFDAGTGIRDLACSLPASVRCSGVFNIFLSHLHYDHIQGFPFFIPAYIPGATVNFYGGHEGIEAALERHQSGPFFPAPLSAMKSKKNFFRLEEGHEYQIAGASVSILRQNHPGVSYGYRVRAGGRTFVYSTDSEYIDNALDDSHPFLAFVRDADLLVYDAEFNFADSSVAKEDWGHSSNILGVDQAVKAGVKRICLYHSDHTCSDIELDSFLQKTREYLSLTAPDSKLVLDQAYDGLEITL